MKTYGLLSAGNVQLHFIAVSPAAAPSPITYTTFLISFAVREHFFRERALTQLTEGCGCKGNFIVAISAFSALKDTPGGSMCPRPRRQLNLCLAGASWRRGGGCRHPAPSDGHTASCSTAPGCIYAQCVYYAHFNKVLLIYPQTGQMLSHYYRQNVA